jgi:hypothetical protein
MSRYRILIADPLLAMKPQWPEGCSLAERQEPGTAGTHWWSFDDPGAPDDLEGRDVEIKLCRGEDGSPQITGRRAIVTHLCPPDGTGEMPCCGLPPFEAPQADKITEDKELVTCGGGESP